MTIGIAFSSCVICLKYAQAACATASSSCIIGFEVHFASKGLSHESSIQWLGTHIIKFYFNKGKQHNLLKTVQRMCGSAMDILTGRLKFMSTW